MVKAAPDSRLLESLIKQESKQYDSYVVVHKNGPTRFSDVRIYCIALDLGRKTPLLLQTA